MQKILTTLILILFFLQLAFSQDNCLDFDGNNDYVAVPDDSSLDITGALTIEAWINPDVISPEKTIVIKGTANQCVNYGLVAKNGNLAYVSSGDCGWNGEGLNSALNLGVWQHVAAVSSGNNLKLYINGSLTDDITLISAIGSPNNQELWIGNSTAVLPNYLNSKIDELRIWNLARTQTEIQNNMNNELNGNETGLVAYYRFNQGTAGGNNSGETTLNDNTSNGNNGTLNNFTLNGNNSNWVASTAPLPVELIDFQGKLNDKEINLQWWTASEINNAGFEVEKLSEGRFWQSIAFVDGKGTTNEINKYQYQDLNPFSGINYYRLKQIDLDGVFEYSKVITVEYNNVKKNIKVFPNPSNGLINIQIDNPVTQGMEIKVVDNLGRKIWESEFIEGESNWRKEMEIEGYGIYIITVRIGAEIFYERMVIKN